MPARFEDPAAAREWCARVRAEGKSLGFVPTMGALHEGHFGLVRRALGENDRVCVSVFVNPLQFDDPEDFARYPRDLDADAGALEEVGCHMVFSGSPDRFFAGVPAAEVPRRDPGPRAEGLEGACRPGHFAGVATIVALLFELVRPARAYFGEKDFQQTLVVRDLARDLGFPEIVVCPTSRDPDGLARSSRNALLGESERTRALALSRALIAARSAWRAGERTAGALRSAMRSVLEDAAVELEYADVRDPEQWIELRDGARLERARALIAARVGRVRLIDNMRLDEDSP